MTDRFVTGASGYLPHLRLDRAMAAKELRYAGLGGRATGRRAVAGWDEDALTLAVEAARPLAADAPDRIVFASTSAPFYERAHSTLLVDALHLPPETRTQDVAGSRRCGAAALLDALLGTGETIIAAGEKRATRIGSAPHLGFGDGGAAVRVGAAGIARLIGHASLSHDLVDYYASREHPTPYAYEERFVRETAVGEVLVPTIRKACAVAGIDASAIRHAAVHEPLAGIWKDVGRKLGCEAPNHAATLEVAAGDLGAGHALFALGLALEAAAPGDLVLLAGFGSGCDALLFETTGRAALGLRETLNEGAPLRDYARFLSLTGAIDLDWGVRAEFSQKAQATALERSGRDAMGFIGGRDREGNVQFPKSRIPVRPGAQGPEPLVDVRLADREATLVSVTADRLNFTPDPPFWFGLVQFDEGARVLMELTDADVAGFKVGDRLRMRLRIKSIDRARGFRTYFWKAAPIARQTLED